METNRKEKFLHVGYNWLAAQASIFKKGVAKQKAFTYSPDKDEHGTPPKGDVNEEKLKTNSIIRTELLLVDALKNLLAVEDHLKRHMLNQNQINGQLGVERAIEGISLALQGLSDYNKVDINAKLAAAKSYYEQYYKPNKAKEFKIYANGMKFTGEKDIIMVMLSDEHKRNIANMAVDGTVYAVFPTTTPKEKIEKIANEFINGI